MASEEGYKAYVGSALQPFELATLGAPTALGNPRTWATNWTDPVSIAPAGGTYDYGAVHRANGQWDLLWANEAAQEIVFTVHRHGRSRSVVLDSGDVGQANLLSHGLVDLGVWLRNENGRSVLMGALLGPGRRVHVAIARRNGTR